MALGGLIVGIDGMMEKGNLCLYVLRGNCAWDKPCWPQACRKAVLMPSRTSYWHLCRPLAHTLDVPIQGFVSDAQEFIRLALQAACPDQPHHCCHYHCRPAGELLTFEADRSMQTTRKQRLRSPLSRLEASIAKKPPADDPWRPLLADYALAVRATLLEGGVAPFALGGVHVFDDLSALAASLQRCRETGGIGSWSA